VRVQPTRILAPEGATTSRNGGRMQPRQDLDLRVKLERRGAVDALGRARDISCGGLGALLTTALTVGEHAQLTMKLPGVEMELKLKVVVAHRRGFHYGLRFVAMSDEERQMVERICQALADWRARAA